MSNNVAFFWTRKELKQLVAKSSKASKKQRSAGLGETFFAKKMLQYRPEFVSTLNSVKEPLNKLLQEGLKNSDTIADRILLLPPFIEIKAVVVLLPGGSKLWRGFVHHILATNIKTFQQFVPQILSLYDQIQKSLEKNSYSTTVGIVKKALHFGGK